MGSWFSLGGHPFWGLTNASRSPAIGHMGTVGRSRVRRRSRVERSPISWHLERLDTRALPASLVPGISESIPGENLASEVPPLTSELTPTTATATATVTDATVQVTPPDRLLGNGFGFVEGDANPVLNVPLSISSQQFGLTSRSTVMLTIRVQGAGDTPIDAAAPQLLGAGGAVIRPLAVNANVAGTNDGFAVFEVKPGAYKLLLFGQDNLSGPVVAEIGLTGDVNGDFRVNQTDLRAVRSAANPQPASSTATVAFVYASTPYDLNGDGRVNQTDVNLVARNLGASTSLRMLELSAVMAAITDPEQDGVTNASKVTIQGTTNPGATVKLFALDKNGKRTSLNRITTANSQGKYQFENVDAAPGPNQWIARAGDRFGQQSATQVNVLKVAQGPGLLRSFDFSTGDNQGWTGGASDYAPDTDVNNLFEIRTGIQAKPATLGNGNAFLLQGHNRSDDLFLYMKKQLNANDGIQPNTEYVVKYQIRFGSNATNDSVGIGGSPGQSVFLKAGASGQEPSALRDASGQLQLNLDKGQQSQGGKDLSVVGNIANGQIAGNAGEPPFVSVNRTDVHESVIKSDAQGRLWLIVGIDSGYEGLTKLFIESIAVTVFPVK